MMKKITFSIILLMFLSNVFSQVGTDCSTPYVVTSLPFNITASSDSTGNNYSNICGSSYSSQNDFVFEFTPSYDIYIDAVTSNTGLYAGLFITDDCPDVGTCVASNEADMGNPELHAIFLQAGVTYYIVISNDDPTGYGLITSINFTLDITEVPPYDAGITEITGLSSGCSLGTEPITVTVENFGADTIYNFDVAYTVNAGLPVIETITDTIFSGDTYSYTFSAQYDFSSVGTYTIAAYTMLSGDTNLVNDGSGLVINSVPTISSFPYNENFDSGNSYWYPEGLLSSWQLGTPSATIINSAASSPNSWVTNLTGNHNDYETSYLVTPCFDLSSLSNPIIEFDIWAEMQDILTSVSLEYTTDGGVTWVPLAAEAANTNWDNPWTGSMGGWTHVSNSVPSLAGITDIQFRYNFASLSTGYEGVALDNFTLRECDAPTPIADFSYVITNDTLVEFTNNSTDATSYSWNFGDFSTDTTENPIHSYLALDNTYTVTLIASNECNSDTIIQTIDITITNINSIENNEIVIYPNPATKYVNIKFDGQAQLSIIDIRGNIIFNDIINDSKKIDINRFEKGIYFVKLQNNEGIIVNKLSIK